MYRTVEEKMIEADIPLFTFYVEGPKKPYVCLAYYVGATMDGTRQHSYRHGDYIVIF